MSQASKASVLKEKLNSTWIERLHNYLHPILPTKAEVCLNTYKANYCTKAYHMHSAYRKRVPIVVRKILVASLRIMHLSDANTALSIVVALIKVLIYAHSVTSIQNILNII